MSKTCPTCGQHIRQTHKEVLNKHKLVMLKDAARYVVEHNTNDFKNRDVGSGGGDVSNYNNFQKLRYHALIAHVTINGVRQRNRWLITRQGWAFLRGDVQLPKWILVRDNHVLDDRSKELIGVKDVYRGSEEVHTTFEYFDEAGKPIGFKPTTAQQTNQATLF